MRYLITGGTGYFGRAMAKMLIAQEETEKVCIYSRNEANQARMRELMPDPEEKLRYLIGDVRDKDRLIWATQNIEVIIHAAALKRIEVGFYNPEEMVKTNIDGSRNVIEAARFNDVAQAVLLSSDKACNPVSAYGISKAMAESLWVAANYNSGPHAPQFLTARYGNVAGSTGSVIPRWRALLKKQDWVPITDQRCTRFWMSRGQACQFVWDMMIDSFHQPKNAPVLKTPNLKAFNLGALAEAMGAKTRVIGLPPFEKPHEEMTPGETSDKAEKLSVDELQHLLQFVPEEFDL